MASARLGVILVFFLHGVGTGMWVARIPAVQERLALGVGLLGLAPNGLALFVALVAWGASTSALDVAMNAQGSTIEQRLGRPIMSSLHGFWSLGNMGGAAVGALLAGAGVAVQPHLAAGAPVLLV